ncbi:pyruvate:ferredoxin (flavodoxin) oxidoreductase [Meiothermus hypogaeus]|uniref:Pyruvate-flavodoxin oxidoreductase n=2 Tax=Meiothermus hypogaeus TaxID=884155 RepID=A0A511R1Q4_9DEIN|nr:pyruvate:ferredoxin (flavodoxin) oxidoreductase [Meiothermus hypogaeus]RIH80162.1 Pyruvate-flavodoxin oxidoreductase [Meiothermus hypogaeus]GEM83541.1 pyruvate-flavodoxin oxidoreductase [Meiothermus hypogaeus NBRC 106114]
MPQVITVDGNEAVARIAHKLNEVIAIYPITPSSPMGEFADQWSAVGQKNLWGTVPLVQEMQSEGGAAGAVHGALQTGALTTTFTASQGLLLMIPNMYKIAGELTSTVFHIAARSIAAQGLSIFGDHSDVMATRATGWAMLFAGSVQEAQDFALIAQASTLESRIPFLHVMDGFRTSHEVMKIEALSDDDLRALVSEDLVRAHRARALSPDRPVIRGTAQNPDVYFQARETVNPFYQKVPSIVQGYMNRFAERTGRQYKLFEYFGSPDAERVVVLMGSGAEAAQETVEYLQARGEKVGLIKVRLYRPFSVEAFVEAVPASARVIAVLDRTKEPGSAGEPLYQDVVTAVVEGIAEKRPKVIGGRYGLSSKEFTPAMLIGLFEEMKKPSPKNHFTLGIHDDLSHTSLPYDPQMSIEPPEVKRSVFWGLGSDGTVGANKNSIKIIGEETDYYAQGYFVYDSKKSGARTISHLRFGPKPIKSTYLIQQADFVAVHQFGFFERFDVLESAAEGATLLINSPYSPAETWNHLPYEVQQQIIQKRLQVYAINAYQVAREVGLGTLMNTVMQVAFFALSGVLPREEAIDKIKEAIRKTYGKRGEAVVRKNFAAVDAALAHLYPLEVPAVATSARHLPPVVSPEAPEFVQKITAPMLAGKGDLLPVSALPADGTYPTGTSRWEKRNIAQEVPLWDPAVCIQCGKCVLVCPHAVIRSKVAPPEAFASAPEGFQTAKAMWKGLEDQRYTLQVAVEDCTGCSLCVEVCPAKNKSQVGRKAINMTPQLPLREQGRKHWDFFLSLPDYPRHDSLSFNSVKNVQLLQPLFEFSGACAGCGETPYLKLLSQLFGDRSLIANATGCSSIYGGNLPTTPWTQNREGRGPAWSNSLFEDNAEFGLGMRLTLDKQIEYARELLGRMRESLGAELVDALLQADQSDEAGIDAQRERVALLKSRLEGQDDPKARDLLSLADVLVRKSVWIVGGDGWAYDIGFGGLDHVLASGRNVKLLVLDTEVYSNTGGQSSKATSLGAVAKFASGGKATPKKDLGRIAMSYGYVYVAQVAMGANDAQTLKAFLEAESYDGPALIIAYSHCIAHGIDMAKGMEQQKLAAESAYWPLYRYDPRLKAQGKNPFQLDSRPPKISFKDYALHENRYRMLRQINPEAEQMFQAAQEAILARWKTYEEMAQSHEQEAAARTPAKATEEV